MYTAVCFALAQAASACSTSVDFPTPGSPPRRTAEPGTNPPPVTRSNSAIFVVRRLGGSPECTKVSSTNGRPFPVRLPVAPTGGAACSSTSVFHAPQSPQRPAHFVCAEPQD